MAKNSSGRSEATNWCRCCPSNGIFPEHQVKCSWNPSALSCIRKVATILACHRTEHMNVFHPQIAAALAATISSAACVAPPAAPTILVAPGPKKTLDRFDADQAACQQYAAAQISPAVAAANNQAVGGALLVQRSERGWVPGSARPQATPAKARRLAPPLAAPSGSSATRMAHLMRTSRCSSNTIPCT